MKGDTYCIEHILDLVIDMLNNTDTKTIIAIANHSLNREFKYIGDHLVEEISDEDQLN